MSNDNHDIKINWLNRLLGIVRKKVRIIIISKETYEEKRAFDVSLIFILVYTSFVLMILILFSYLIISATSLKYLIPGFPNTVDIERIEQIDKNSTFEY